MLERERRAAGNGAGGLSSSPQALQEGDYRPFSILITGGAGFIASHVARRFVERYPEYKVVVLDNLEYCGSLENLKCIMDRPNFFFVEGDILSCEGLRSTLEAHDIDTVLHFAAQTHVDNSFGNSLEFSMTNVYGTHSLLEVCRVWGRIKRFVNVSTDEVYGEQSFGRSEANCESSVLEPTNPYSAAKAGAEMMVMAYFHSYNLPCITTRGNNVYGPHQFPEKLVPKLILLGCEGKKLPIHGTGENTRSFLYVDDVAAAYDVILHQGALGQIYNIGTQKERKVIEVARDICKLCKLDPDDHIELVKDRCFNDRRYFISDEKLRQLGWKPEVEWEEGLARTFRWYRDSDLGEYWKLEDLLEALKPHPTFLAKGGPMDLKKV
ncbi:NAD-dependent epimerase/dehydratase [Chloropicon primus]|nr:NAD-dependent epimerase/dehydratase [Chloropicon primus]